MTLTPDDEGDIYGLPVENVAFRKSSASGRENCVEVSVSETGALVRDSKDQSGAVLRFSPSEWRAFVDGIRMGEFDI